MESRFGVRDKLMCRWKQTKIFKRLIICNVSKIDIRDLPVVSEFIAENLWLSSGDKMKNRILRKIKMYSVIKEFDIRKQLCWLFWKWNYSLQVIFSGFIFIHFPELMSQYFEQCNIYHYRIQKSCPFKKSSIFSFLHMRK